MPQGAVVKKKKGRAPAHQNTFAFSHNPKSKKTAEILSAPIERCCRRCYDKLEWRKRYRKYKPRTVPGKCNLCEKRNVSAAYHTICRACTKESAKAQELLAEFNSDNTSEPYTRVCAICVKEPALPDEESDIEGVVDPSTTGGRMKLRHVRSLERQRERQALPRHPAPPMEEEGLRSSAYEASEEPDETDTDDDPFLMAVGGADQLLTGEAYQRKLLQEQERLAQIQLSGSS